MSKLTEEQIEKIVILRERGRSCATIAKQFGVSRGAINYQCLKAGAISPHQRRMHSPTEATSFVGRDGRTFKTFTQTDDDRLLHLRTSGMAIHLIAAEMGRAITSVRMRLMLLAVRDDMPE